MMNAFTLFAGTANPALAAGIACELDVRLGACAIERFPDGEISVRLDAAVRGREVFLLQPTSPPVLKAWQRSEPPGRGLRSPLRPHTGCCSPARATS